MSRRPDARESVIGAPTTPQKRERQLDVIVAILVLALLFTLAALIYYLSFSGIRLPDAVPLADYFTRTLLAGFTLALLLYVHDQRRRLRAQAAAALQEAEDARLALDTTVAWLRLSHQAASTLAEEGVDSGLIKVLSATASQHVADAAAVIGVDLESVHVADSADREQAERALMHIALAAAGRPTPLLIESLGTEEGQAIAVPLRVEGELRFVLCLWRREGGFLPEQLESLGLMGRMIELAIEREESLDDAQSQLEGTLSVLQYLVADKRPDYSEHAMRVSELAGRIAQAMGVPVADRKALRLAGLIHDVGIMAIPDDIAAADQPLTHEERLVVRQHPRVGSEIAAVAHFDPLVQEAVAGHHERIDGSGYPSGLSGEHIPLLARILAVCEVFDSMTHRTYHGRPATTDEAVRELRANAGVLYDGAVVNALLEELGRENEMRLFEATYDLDALSVE